MAQRSNHRDFMNRTSLALLLLVHGTLVAAEWTQWRGSNRDGDWTESGILSSFPSSGLVPKWKVPVGFGYSSPIITNGMLYLTDLIVEKPIVHERFLCLNVRSGKRVWMTEHDASPPDWFFSPAQMRGPGSTPIIHKGRVYGLSMFSTLKCLDARTGTVLWKRDLVADRKVFVRNDRELRCYSLAGNPGHPRRENKR